MGFSLIGQVKPSLSNISRTVFCSEGYRDRAEQLHNTGEALKSFRQTMPRMSYFEVAVFAKVVIGYASICRPVRAGVP